MTRRVGPDGEQVEVLVRGAGAPVMFLPPLGATVQVWGPLFSLLERDFQLIAVSPPGIGGSDRGGADPAAQAERLLRLPKALGLQGPVHLVGWSLGGCLAQHLALEHRSELASLSLVCTTARAFGRHSTSGLFQVLERVTGGLAAELATVTDHADRARYERLIGLTAGLSGAVLSQARALTRFDALARLAEIDLPTLVVSGDQDKVLPGEQVQAMHSHIPGARSVRVPEAGHLLPLTASQRLASELRGFIGAVEPSRL